MKSHVQAVFRAKGEEGVRALEACYGKSLAFKVSDTIPVKDESRLIECATRILADHPIPEDRIAYEAGKVHFKNFSQTPLGRLTLPFFKNNYRLILLRARYLGAHVFQGVKFASEELGPKTVYLVMSNTDYPIDHFKGLFQAWMEYCGLTGAITPRIIESKVHGYTIEWQ
ncbi:MAG TPA: TIGR02265 family protein [Candidatus Paceibacterota bacterium]|nr:TIGR02265 family protein [Candidatus Paceibacterota bacterium]